MPQNKKYTVIKDTREQTGWNFLANQYCEGTVVETLHTADYTIRGYEDLLAIERKRSTAEIAANLFDKRFDNELKRLEAFPYAFIICEFSARDIENFPKDSGIPPKMWGKLKVTPSLLIKRLVEIELLYKVKIILASSDITAKKWASSIFKRMVELY